MPYHVGSALLGYTMLLTAQTLDELHDRLPGLSFEVPPHPAPRGETPELYSVVHLLGSIPLCSDDFPCSSQNGSGRTSPCSWAAGR